LINTLIIYILDRQWTRSAAVAKKCLSFSVTECIVYTSCIVSTHRCSRVPAGKDTGRCVEGGTRQQRRSHAVAHRCTDKQQTTRYLLTR